MIFLETERLRLRNVNAQDGAIMFDYRNNELCARYQRGQTKDLAGIAELISRRAGDRLNTDSPSLLAVALKDTDRMVGEIVVMPAESTFSLGYTFCYKHHRQGYAYEALSALLHTLHTQYPTWEFISFTHPENQASMGLLKKLGYQDLGYLPAKASQVFGKWITPDTEAEIANAQKKGL